MELSSGDLKLKPLKNIKNKPFRICGGYIYKINDKGIVVRIPDIEEIGFYFRPNAAEFIENYSSFSCSDLVMRAAGATMKAGDTYADLQRAILEKQKHYVYINELHKQKKTLHPKEKGLDRFITKIFSPVIIRVPENKNKKTFDIIKLYINICTTWESDRESYIIANLKEIIKRANDSLEKNKSFKKYGVPINCLAITKILKDTNNSILIVYELKKEIREGRTNE